MQLYFTKYGSKFKGKPITPITAVINKEFLQIYPALQLKTLEDLKRLRYIAQNRKEWKQLIKKFTEIAEAAYSK